MIRRCQWCSHGFTAKDGETPFTVCALLPPQPVMVNHPEHGATIQWHRPNMSQRGWCGQFSLSVARLLGYGPRA